jgi:hypothetical protein
MMATYPKCANFADEAFNAKWKALFWRAGLILARTLQGHKAKNITLK